MGGREGIVSSPPWVWMTLLLQGHTVGLLQLKCWACDLLFSPSVSPLPAVAASRAFSIVWSLPLDPMGKLCWLLWKSETGCRTAMSATSPWKQMSCFWHLTPVYLCFGSGCYSSISCMPWLPVVRWGDWKFVLQPIPSNLCTLSSSPRVDDTESFCLYILIPRENCFKPDPGLPTEGI